MKTAAEYAHEAEKRVSRSEDGSLARAQVFATLAQAAATLEAARMRITAEASNLLSALGEPEDETDAALMSTTGSRQQPGDLPWDEQP